MITLKFPVMPEREGERLAWRAVEVPWRPYGTAADHLPRELEVERVVIDGAAHKPEAVKLRDGQVVMVVPRLGEGFGSLIGGVVGGILGFVLSGGNPAAAALGFSVGAALGGAIDRPKIPKPPAIAGAGPDVPSTYGFSGEANLAAPGDPVPVVFGETRVEPPLIRSVITRENDNDVWNLLFAVSQGPLAGISDVRLNDLPISNYPGASYQARIAFEGALPLGHHVSSAQTVVQNVELTTTPFVYTTTPGKNVIGFEVLLTLPTGLSHVNDDGSVTGNGSTYRVRYRKQGAGSWTVLEEKEIFNLQRTAALRRTARFNPADSGLATDPGVYEIELTWLSARATDPTRSQWKVWLAGVTEIEAGENTYPGIDLLAVKAPASERLRTRPTVSCLATAQTSNPAEAIKRMITYQRWGLGNWVPESDIVQSTFDEVAADCDALVSDGKGGLEAKHRIDIGINRQMRAPDLLAEMARTCRAFVIRSGRKWSLRTDKDETPVQLFSAGNVIAGSVRKAYSATTDGFNAYDVTFINKSNDYTPTPIQVVSKQQVTVQGKPVKPRRAELHGIQRESHAVREASYMLNKEHYLTRSVEFAASVDSILCQAGDIIWFQDTYFAPTAGGRALGGTAGGIQLERTVTLAAGKTYEVIVRHADDTIEKRTVADPPGAYSTLTVTVNFASAPAKDDVYTFGEQNTSARKYRVVSISRDGALRRLIRAHQHDAQVYNPDLVTFQQTPAAIANPAHTPPVENLSLYEEVVIRPTGEVAINLLVSWTPPQGTQGYRGADVYTSSDGGLSWKLQGTAQASLKVPGVREGVTYLVRAATKVTLAAQDLAEAAQAQITIQGDIIPPPDVAGLLLEGDRIVWSYPNPPDDLKGFQVRFHLGHNTFWPNAIPAHAELLKGSSFDISTLPGGTLTIMVKAFDFAGNESAGAAVLVKNLGDPLTLNVDQEVDLKAQGFPGTVTNGAVDAGDLKANDSGAKFWGGADENNFWAGNDNVVFWGGSYLQMAYTFELTPELDHVDAVLKFLFTVAAESWAFEYRTSQQIPAWSMEGTKPFWISDAASYWTPMPEFRPWPGELPAPKREKHEFKITTQASRVRGVISRLKALYDFPDVEESLEDVQIQAGGTRLPITKTYTKKIVAVALTLQDDGGTAVRLELADKDRLLGPLVIARDGAGSSTTALIDVPRIKGY